MKDKIKKLFGFFTKLIAAGMTSIVILSAFAAVYCLEGVHISNPDGATDYKWEPYQRKSQMVEGFSFLKMDSAGYNNGFAPDGNPDILIMGSSHIEAVELMQSENVASLLGEKLPGCSVYDIGISGHTIYRCADNIEAAAEKYKPGKYVIIGTDRVELDENSMKEVIEGSADIIPSYDSGILYRLQKIPAVKLLYSQLDKWVSKSEDISFEKPFKVSSDAQKEDDITEVSEDYEENVLSFLGIISDCAEKNGFSVIIFYHPSQSLCEDGSAAYGTDSEYLRVFSDLCRENGIIFVDMTPDFEKLYNEKHIMAHGFSNTAVGVGHMNKYAHRVIAEKLSEIINEAEADK